jgi:hypothetical protein
VSSCLRCLLRTASCDTPPLSSLLSDLDLASTLLWCRDRSDVWPSSLRLLTQVSRAVLERGALGPGDIRRVFAGPIQAVVGGGGVGREVAGPRR